MHIAPVRREHFACWLQMRSDLYSGLTEQFHAEEMEWIFTSADKTCFLAWASDDSAAGLLELSLRNIVDGCVGAPVGYIEGLYLRPDQRGRGLGRQLLEHAEQWFHAQGCRAMATDTELDNTAAQEFFRHAGFEETYRIVEFRKPLADTNRL